MKKAIRNVTRAVSGLVNWNVNAAKSYIDWNVRVVEKAKDSQAVRMAVAAVAAYYTAGAASSWFTSWASESAFATSAFASESLAYAYGAQTAIYSGEASSAVLPPAPRQGLSCAGAAAPAKGRRAGRSRGESLPGLT